MAFPFSFTVHVSPMFSLSVRALGGTLCAGFVFVQRAFGVLGTHEVVEKHGTVVIANRRHWL